MPRAPAWTPDQLTALRRWYNRKPLPWIQKVLSQKGPPRNIPAIKLQAQKHGLADVLPPGYGRLVDAHHKRMGANQGATRAIINAAKRDGVHKQLKHMRGRPHIAPNTWIDAYQAALIQQRDLEHDTRDWWTTTMLADALGVRRHHITDAIAAGVRGTFARDVRACRRARLTNTTGRPWRWHPTDCEALVAKHGRRRRAA